VKFVATITPFSLLQLMNLKSFLTYSIPMELSLSDHLELLTEIWSMSHATYGSTCLM